MRRAWLVAALLVSGCLGLGDTQGDATDDVPTLTVSPAPADLVIPPAGEGQPDAAPTLTVTPAPDGLDMTATGAPTEAENTSEPKTVTVATVPTPPPPSPAQRDCERTGGRWAKAGPVGFICYRPQSDANRSCARAGDCDGACLAKSRTCAPISPLIGCHEILTASGTRATQCRTF